MIVLGIQPGMHDSSAALLIDGKVVAGVAQERLSRNKHAFHELPTQAVVTCLSEANLTLDDVDVIALPGSGTNSSRMRWGSFRRSLGRRGGKAWSVLFSGPKKQRRWLEKARATLDGVPGSRRPLSPV